MQPTTSDLPITISTHPSLNRVSNYCQKKKKPTVTEIGVKEEKSEKKKLRVMSKRKREKPREEKRVKEEKNGEA